MGGPTILRLPAVAIGWTREKSKIEFIIAYRSLSLRVSGKA
jgi:hypothetical protein